MIMFLGNTKRQKDLLYHRNTYSTCMDQPEYDHRNYLVLLSHFSDNLNTFTNNLQGCISDLDERPKFRMSRVEKQILGYGHEYISQQYINRLSKEIYYRNAIIRRDYNLFLDDYYSHFSSKTQRKYYPKTRKFHCKSFTLKQQTTPRISLNAQFSQRRESKNPLFVIKGGILELKGSKSLEKHQLQDFKMLAKKRKVNRLIQLKQLAKSAVKGKQNSDFEVMGDQVVVNQCMNKCQYQSWQCSKVINNPIKTFITSRVLAFRNRMATNPQKAQISKALKQKNMPKMTYFQFQSSPHQKKAFKTFSEQIKLN